ncbi:MAG TPA: formate dehydrogenase accessory sulfurtransferase FdhD, partial [Chitinophagaceae bacterium]|nr:formate dehydrogenase accessory sulfurtransferase FdhD [Chitinophagaceae bacterium]
MQSTSVASVQILKVTSPGSDKNSIISDAAEDLLAVEEPLEIRIIYGPEKERRQKNISVTMCTPGNDEELATGFLFTEGIIRGKNEIRKCFSPGDNIIVADLLPGILFDMQKLERHFYT